MKKNNKNFGIVQGRLTKSKFLQKFPKNWKKEFSVLKNSNLDFIELLDERKKNSSNPLSYDSGFNEINNILKINKVAKYSLCTDYIIDNNLFAKNNKKTYLHVERLIRLSGKNKYKVFVLPLLEASLVTKKNWGNAINVLKKLALLIVKYDIIICLETILSGKNLIKLLKSVNSNKVKCVFDTGNRVLLSSSLEKEILLLNKFIGHVHLKDKNSKNQNVILGTGKVNFLSIFSAFKKINFKGKFVFETNRGLNPKKTATYNRIFCDYFIQESN